MRVEKLFEPDCYCHINEYAYLMVNIPVIKQNVMRMAGWSGSVTKYAKAPAAKIPTSNNILEI